MNLIEYTRIFSKFKPVPVPVLGVVGAICIRPKNDPDKVRHAVLCYASPLKYPLKTETDMNNFAEEVLWDGYGDKIIADNKHIKNPEYCIIPRITKIYQILDESDIKDMMKDLNSYITKR
jgi:hypothetical protein